MPGELGKLSKRMVNRVKQVGFFKYVFNPRGTIILANLSPTALTVYPLQNRMREHGVPISITQGMKNTELEKHLIYGTHTSALKDKTFFRRDLAEKLRAGHINIFPWEAVKHLMGLWLSLLAVIPQTGQKPRIVYDFSWICLNAKAKQYTPKKSM